MGRCRVARRTRGSSAAASACLERIVLGARLHMMLLLHRCPRGFLGPVFVDAVHGHGWHTGQVAPAAARSGADSALALLVAAVANDTSHAARNHVGHAALVLVGIVVHRALDVLDHVLHVGALGGSKRAVLGLAKQLENRQQMRCGLWPDRAAVERAHAFVEQRGNVAPQTHFIGNLMQLRGDEIVAEPRIDSSHTGRKGTNERNNDIARSALDLGHKRLEHRTDLLVDLRILQPREHRRKRRNAQQTDMRVRVARQRDERRNHALRNVVAAKHFDKGVLDHRSNTADRRALVQLKIAQGVENRVLQDIVALRKRHKTLRKQRNVLVAPARAVLGGHCNNNFHQRARQIRLVEIGNHARDKDRKQAGALLIETCILLVALRDSTGVRTGRLEQHAAVVQGRGMR
eukprot:comp21133_c0_seq1/m.44705 comp21133_c0_seq1/g.44705  ORF comp21133_c0_seq1/g.44705 comp21133_c0_seq1/m.44705 type:complete len:404 (+) comp21133_c0_seq1:784-1995(+)